MHLTLELDDRTAACVNTAAQNAGLSPAEWITRLIERQTAADWPDHVKALAGAWRDEPWPDTAGAAAGQDMPREPF
jgi:hypothetical protein